MNKIKSGEADAHSAKTLGPDLERARRTALTAHDVVIRLKEMGLPAELDEDLAALSTDLGDLWGAHLALEDRLQALLDSNGDWDSVGDNLVDLRATIDHIRVHVESVREPMSRLAEYAYERASEESPD